MNYYEKSCRYNEEISVLKGLCVRPCMCVCGTWTFPRVFTTSTQNSARAQQTSTLEAKVKSLKVLNNKARSSDRCLCFWRLK